MKSLFNFKYINSKFSTNTTGGLMKAGMIVFLVVGLLIYFNFDLIGLVGNFDTGGALRGIWNAILVVINAIITIIVKSVSFVAGLF